MSIVMTAEKFVDAMKYAEAKKTLYVLGGWGYPLRTFYNDKGEVKIDNKTRAIAASTYNAGRRDMIMSASADTFAADCVNIGEHFWWGGSLDPNDVNGGAVYGSNGVPDVTDAGVMALCYDVSTDFENIQPGEFVWFPGHCGYFIERTANGGGLVIECTPAWENRVQYSNLGNLQIIANAALPVRKWQKHGKIPWLDYTGKKNGVIFEDGEYHLYKNGAQIMDTGEHFVDGFHWIDEGGIVAVNKDVWMPYIYADEKPGSTDGKWVRFDDRGNMVYGWSANKTGGFSFFDLTTGAMMKGKQIITSNCEFDEETGELKNIYYM